MKTFALHLAIKPVRSRCCQDDATLLLTKSQARREKAARATCHMPHLPHDLGALSQRLQSFHWGQQRKEQKVGQGCHRLHGIPIYHSSLGKCERKLRKIYVRAFLTQHLTRCKSVRSCWRWGDIMTTAHSTHALSLSLSLADLHSAWLESTQYDGRLRASATGHRTLHRALSNPIAGEHSQPGELPLQVRLHSRPHRPLRAMLRRVARATDAAPCAA